MDKETPPIYGDIEFVLPLAPVSQQASTAAKAAIEVAVLAVTQPLEFILTGDVQIEFEWLVHKRNRYETDASPDIDNIIKPLLDALCGPTSILIDDCQVQSVASHWIDWPREDHQLTTRIKYTPDDWIQKDQLYFVKIDKSLCLPIPGHLPSKATGILLDLVESSIATRDQLESLTGDYYQSRIVMPIQRLQST